MATYYISGAINAPHNGKAPEPSLVKIRKERLTHVASILRQQPSRQVINPVEIGACGDDYWFCDGATTGKHTRACCLRYDVRELTMCDYIVLLEGWQDSPGARLELKVSLLLGICPLFWSDPDEYWYPEPIGEKAQNLFAEMKKVYA